MKTPPLSMTQDNFCAVVKGLKTETRRLSSSDKPKYDVGDRCYLTEPTQVIELNLENALVQYSWKVGRKFLPITESDLKSLNGRKTGCYSKQIARFMLKSFARYHVEILEISRERLFDITAEAAIAEGIKYIKRPELVCPVYFDYIRNEYIHADPIESYITEIEMLHGKAVVESNPFLWVYKFKFCP